MGSENKMTFLKGRNFSGKKNLADLRDERAFCIFEKSILDHEILQFKDCSPGEEDAQNEHILDCII